MDRQVDALGVEARRLAASARGVGVMCNFTAERAELLQELKDIGVEEPALAASSQVPRPSSGLSGSWRGVEMEASQRDSTPNPLLVLLERFLQHLILDRATGDSKPRHKAAT